MAREETRKLNINYSNKNRGSKKKSFRSDFKFKPGEEFLKESGLLENFNEFVIGAKYCLPTNKLNNDQIEQIKELFGEGETKQNIVSSFGINDSGWLGTTFDINDLLGKKPVLDINEISPALDKYREFAEGNEDLFISSYGNFKARIDFSKFGMLGDPDTGDIYYPYGAMFFSDNKHMNQFEATVACIPKRYDNIKNKKSIKPITCDNWTNGVIEGNFTRHGYLVIFYVTNELVKENNEYHPVVTTAVIELVAKKDYKTSKIDNVYVGRVKLNSVCVPDVCEYIIEEIYKKYTTVVEKSNVKYCMIDWIYSVGNNPKNYNLKLEEQIPNIKTPEFKSNLSIGNKRRVVVETKESQVEEEVEESVESADECPCCDPSPIESNLSDEEEIAEVCENEDIRDAEIDEVPETDSNAETSED